MFRHPNAIFSVLHVPRKLFQFCLVRVDVNYVSLGVTSYCGIRTRHNTPIHNILSTGPQLSISQKALGTLPEDGNVMPKYVGATIYN
jgi:hypothetical protein